MAIASKKKSPRHRNIKSILRLGKYREPAAPPGAVVSRAAKTSREEESMDTNVKTIRKLEEMGLTSSGPLGPGRRHMRRDGVSECVRIVVDEAHSNISTQKVRILTRMLASGTQGQRSAILTAVELAVLEEDDREDVGSADSSGAERTWL